MFWTAGYRETQLQSLNRCCLAHKAIFLSNLATACRQFFDLTFLRPSDTREGTAPRSSFVFPNERPSRTNWKLWGDFLSIFHRIRMGAEHPLGGFAGLVPPIMGMALPQVGRYVIPMAGGYDLGIHSNSNKGNSTIMPRVPPRARHRPNTRWMGSSQHACCSGKCS
jgi:hypothetical protein